MLKEKQGGRFWIALRSNVKTKYTRPMNCFDLILEWKKIFSIVLIETICHIDETI